MPHSHPLSKRAGMRASKKRWLSAFFPISSLVERARVRLVAGYASYYHSSSQTFLLSFTSKSLGSTGVSVSTVGVGADAAIILQVPSTTVSASGVIYVFFIVVFLF